MVFRDRPLRLLSLGSSLAALAIVCVLSGCGGGSDQPLVAPSLKRTGTVSAKTASAPIIRDMLAIHDAANQPSEAATPPSRL
jgi:hypothetical protein